MIAPIRSQVIKRVPYVGPVIQGVGLAMDAKEIIESSTPIGATKIIAGRFIKECTPPEIFIAGKCVMFVGGVIDFLRYMKVNEKNHRQRINMVEIFKQFEYLHDFKLQTFRTTLDDSLILNDNSNDAEFTSVVMIPYLKVKKNGRLWTVNVAIAKELYEYKYPFQINEYFLTWKTIYQFQVKSQMIEVIAKNSLKKELYIEEFLKPFNIPNKKQTQLKQMIIEAISEEINNYSIQPQFKVIQKDGSIKKINKLQTKDISQIKVISFYENIDYKSLFK